MKPRLLISTLVAGLALAVASGAGAHGLTLSFDMRSVSPRTWEGTVAGDLSGSVTMRIRRRTVSGQRWRVATTWAVDAGENALTAGLRGIVNLETRRIRLDGSVASGLLAGSEASARGRVRTLRRHRLVGTVTVVPPHERAVTGSRTASATTRANCDDRCVSIYVVRHGDGLVTSTFGVEHGAIACGTVCDAVSSRGPRRRSSSRRRKGRSRTGGIAPRRTRTAA
jgi:hypothetical protein